MSSMEDGGNGFEKGKHIDGKNCFYQKLRGLVPKTPAQELFDKSVGEEPESVSISKDGFKKLLYPYGRMLGISDDVMEKIVEDPSASNGDVVMARVKHEYVKVCKARGGYFPRGYEG